MNKDPGSSQTRVDAEGNDLMNAEEEGVNTNGTVTISEEDIGTGNDVIKESAGVSPVFTPIEPPKFDEEVVEEI